MWCVAELDQKYVIQMEDVLEVYERPNDPKQPVVCLDEKPIALHADVRPASPAAPGREARQDKRVQALRHGPCLLRRRAQSGPALHFPHAGSICTRVRPGPFPLALRYPEADTIHLVMDNLNIHHRKSLTDFYGIEVGTEIWDRFTVHYTPKHGSWLNQGEIEIGLFSRQCLGKRRIPDLATLRRESRAWNRRVNRAQLKINWKFDRRAARRKFGYKKNSFKRSKT
jgi:hypothetical protein